MKYITTEWDIFQWTTSSYAINASIVMDKIAQDFQLISICTWQSNQFSDGDNLAIAILSWQQKIGNKVADKTF